MIITKAKVQNMGKRIKTLIWGWVTCRKDLVKFWNLSYAEGAVRQRWKTLFFFNPVLIPPPGDPNDH